MLQRRPQDQSKPAAGGTRNQAPQAPAWDVANNCRDTTPARPAKPPKLATRRAQHEARRWLWANAGLHRLQTCGKVPTGEVVELAIRDGVRAHWSGLATCGSVWSCPVCSERIWAGRSDDVAEVFRQAYAEGYTVSLITLTLRHAFADSLAVMLDAINDAWAAANRSSAVRSMREVTGFVGAIRRVEVTHGGVNGWHPHVHAYVITEKSGVHRQLGRSIHRAFNTRLGRHGFESWQDHGGLDTKELDLAAALEAAAGYAAKGAYEMADVDADDDEPGQAGPDDALRAAREISGGRGKLGRRGSRSNWQILDDAAAGDVPSKALWHEWERATKGRKALTWTNGLRERFQLPDELTDDELAADNDGEQTTIAAVQPHAWSMIRRDHSAQLELLEIVEGARPHQRFEAAQAYLDARGIPVVLLRPGQDPYGGLAYAA